MLKIRSFSVFQKLGRLLKLKLIIPILRLKHPPEYKARGVAVGLAWAMTPLVGIQMWLVFMTWIFLKKVFHWHFSLGLAIVWTWVTNVFTVPPVYYIFYATGQIMQSREVAAYQNLKKMISETFLSNLSFSEQWVLFFKLLVKDWGFSMAIGCLPWALLFGVSGYYLTYRFECGRLRKKEQKEISHD